MNLDNLKMIIKKLEVLLEELKLEVYSNDTHVQIDDYDEIDYDD